MRILLTGSNGFIGRNLTEYLKENYTLLTPSRNELNLLDEDAVQKYFLNHSPNQVIHCAGEDKEGCYYTNLRMFLNVWKWHREYNTGKMIYFGSGAEFNRRKWHGKMKEDYFGNSIPDDEYGLAKYTMKRLVENDKTVLNLRLFGVFGRYEERRVRFISAFCKSLIEGKEFYIKKDVLFDYLYVPDLCKIVEWFLNNEPRYSDYNICTDNLYSLKEIALRLIYLTNKVATIKVGLEKLSYTEYGGTNNRLFGECPIIFTPFDQALKEMYAYYESKYIG